MTWDREALNQQFRSRAEEHRLYLRQCRERARSNPSYERLFDETFASYEAYDYFVDRTFLNSPDALLAELHSIRDRNHTPTDVFDEDTYQRRWKAEIDALIARYSEA